MGSIPAEKCVELIENKLNSYNLSLKSDIVCMTTDGAAVMKKLGRLIMVDQVICLAHGIHLVVKVLYIRNYNCEDNNENVQCTSLENLDNNENYEDEHDFDNAADGCIYGCRYSKSMRVIITKQISDIKLNKKFNLTDTGGI